MQWLNNEILVHVFVHQPVWRWGKSLKWWNYLKLVGIFTGRHKELSVVESGILCSCPKWPCSKDKSELDEMKLQMASDLNSVIMKWHKKKMSPLQFANTIWMEGGKEFWRGDCVDLVIAFQLWVSKYIFLLIFFLISGTVYINSQGCLNIFFSVFRC